MIFTCVEFPMNMTADPLSSGHAFLIIFLKVQLDLQTSLFIFFPPSACDKQRELVFISIGSPPRNQMSTACLGMGGS